MLARRPRITVYGRDNTKQVKVPYIICGPFKNVRGQGKQKFDQTRFKRKSIETKVTSMMIIITILIVINSNNNYGKSNK